MARIAAYSVFEDATERDAAAAPVTGQICTLESDSQVYRYNGSSWVQITDASVSSTDEAVCRFDGTTGKIQDSLVSISDTGSVTLDSASSTLLVGDGTGSPFAKINKAVAGTGRLDFLEAGATKFLFYADASAQLIVARSGAASMLTFKQSDGSAKFSGDLEMDAALNHDGSTVGFYGATPAVKPTVTGSRGGNAALASLLTALASLGLITDSST